MKSKFTLDASKRGHGQPEATDVVRIGRREADPRLGSRLCASWFSVVRREKMDEEEEHSAPSCQKRINSLPV